VKARIDEAQAKMRAAAERARAKRERLQRERDAKIKVLQDQMVKAKAEAKAANEHRMTEFRADYDQRADKLMQAAALVDEALS
jgi:hypothetical protein